MMDQFCASLPGKPRDHIASASFFHRGPEQLDLDQLVLFEVALDLDEKRRRDAVLAHLDDWRKSVCFHTEGITRGLGEHKQLRKNDV